MIDRATDDVFYRLALADVCRHSDGSCQGEVIREPFYPNYPMCRKHDAENQGSDWDEERPKHFDLNSSRRSSSMIEVDHVMDDIWLADHKPIRGGNVLVTADRERDQEDEDDDDFAPEDEAEDDDDDFEGSGPDEVWADGKRVSRRKRADDINREPDPDCKTCDGEGSVFTDTEDYLGDDECPTCMAPTKKDSRRHAVDAEDEPDNTETTKSEDQHIEEQSDEDHKVALRYADLYEEDEDSDEQKKDNDDFNDELEAAHDPDDGFGGKKAPPFGSKDSRRKMSGDEYAPDDKDDDEDSNEDTEDYGNEDYHDWNPRSPKDSRRVAGDDFGIQHGGPYRVIQSGNQWAVVDNAGDVIKTCGTQEEAESHKDSLLGRSSSRRQALRALADAEDNPDYEGPSDTYWNSQSDEKDGPPGEDKHSDPFVQQQRDKEKNSRRKALREIASEEPTFSPPNGISGKWTCNSCGKDVGGVHALSDHVDAHKETDKPGDKESSRRHAGVDNPLSGDYASLNDDNWCLFI